MATRERRNITAEFKREAVKLAEQPGRSLTASAPSVLPVRGLEVAPPMRVDAQFVLVARENWPFVA